MTDFSSFREMLREERETWTAEQRQLTDEVEFRVQLAISGRQSQGSLAVEGRSTTTFAGANLGIIFRMKDTARRLAGIRATISGGESGRSIGGAVQGSAATVSDRVP